MCGLPQQTSACFFKAIQPSSCLAASPRLSCRARVQRRLLCSVSRLAVCIPLVCWPRILGALELLEQHLCGWTTAADPRCSQVTSLPKFEVPGWCHACCVSWIHAAPSLSHTEGSPASAPPRCKSAWWGCCGWSWRCAGGASAGQQCCRPPLPVCCRSSAALDGQGNMWTKQMDKEVPKV